MDKLSAQTLYENRKIVDEERAKLFEALDSHKPDSEGYEAIMARLQDLQKVEESLTRQALDAERLTLEQEKLYVDASPKPVSKDALVGAGATVAGILLVIAYELFGESIITSKAFAMIPKPRLR